MAINPHDDYEALAKLLYPSIEASGNVYYGQTRKLTMDEILGKNDLGFESHIESVRVADSEADYGFTYDSYFCWKLGPLKGSLKVALSVNDSSDTFPEANKIILRESSGDTVIKDDDNNVSKRMVGTAYACYSIVAESKEIENNLHSGVYSTYEREFSLHLEQICVIEDGVSPADITKPAEEDRSFYFDSDNNLLYVVVCNGIVCNNSATSTALDLWENNRSVFRIKALDGDLKIKYAQHFSDIQVSGSSSEPSSVSAVVTYSIGPNDPQITLQPDTYVTIPAGASLSFHCEFNTDDRLPVNFVSSDDDSFNGRVSYFPYGEHPEFGGIAEMGSESFLEEELSYVHFQIEKLDSNSTAHASLIGDMSSLVSSTFSYLHNNMSAAKYACMFKDCTLITDVSEVYDSSFKEGRVQEESYYYAYYKTFAGCTGITKASVCIRRLYNHSFVKTYSGCSNLKDVRFSIGASLYDTTQSSDNTFLNCNNENVSYTVSEFPDSWDSPLEEQSEWFSESLYNVVKTIVNPDWNLDNWYLLFTKVGPGDVTITINNTGTWHTVDGLPPSESVTQFRLPNESSWHSATSFTLTDQSPKAFFRVNSEYHCVSRSIDSFKFAMSTDDTSGSTFVRVYGRLESVLGYVGVDGVQYAYSELFKDCALLQRGPNIIGSFASLWDNWFTYTYYCMYQGCTSLIEFPRIRTWGLGYKSFASAFEGCTSLSEITKMREWFDPSQAFIPPSGGNTMSTAINEGTHVFDSMFKGCTSLTKVPEILFGNDLFEFNNSDTLPDSTYLHTFSNCASLKTLNVTGKSDSDFSNNQFLVTMDSDNYSRCLFSTKQDDVDWKGLNYIPEKWVFSDNSKFNCRLLSPNGENGEIKSGVIISSGADAKNNGRGLVTSKSTESSMLQYNPAMLGKQKMDSYDLTNGQFNQDIWGIKCFNSPVAFRNGVYFDGASITSLDNSDFKFNIETYICPGSSSRFRRTDRDIELEADNVYSSKFGSKSGDAVSNVEVVTADLMHGNTQLKRAQTSSMSYLSGEPNISPSVTLDTLYVENCACIRTGAYTEVTHTETGYFDELDGWTCNSTQYGTNDVLVSTMSAGNSYVAAIQNKSNTTVAIKADDVYIDGYISSLGPHVNLGHYNGDIVFPIGSLIVIKIGLPESFNEGYVSPGNIIEWRDDRKLYAYKHVPQQRLLDRNNDATFIYNNASSYTNSWKNNTIYIGEIGTGSISFSGLDGSVEGYYYDVSLRGMAFLPISRVNYRSAPVVLAIRVW